MRLETRLRLYVAFVHVIFGTLLLYSLADRPWLLLASELVLIVSLGLGWRLISTLFVPLRLIETGTDLIDERDFASTFVPVGQPEMDRLIEVYNRMIKALREERLHGREQEDFLSRVIDASPAGVLICDLDGALTRLNPAAERLIGRREEDSGKDIEEENPAPSRLELLPSPWGESLPSLEAGESRILTLNDGRRVRCRAGELRDRGFRRRFLILEELTEELRLSEKAAYEKLIRMVSHEVNNSVGAVTSLLGSLGHYRDQLEPEDRDDFAGALDVGSGRLERLRAFIDAFADLVRLPEPDKRPLDLDSLLDELLTLYTPSLVARGIRIERTRALGQTRRQTQLHADRQQLEQALINVLENAAEAIGRDGTIHVRTGLLGQQGPGLVIEDDGPGLDPRTSGELFTPFFTTKPEGQGLGLTLVKEVLTRHGYAFTLENRPSGGCRFEIRFGLSP